MIDEARTIKTVCAIDSCTGCMACVEKCNKSAISIKDSMYAYNAVIDETRCINCGACKKVCPNRKKVKLYQPIGSFEGWTKDSVRKHASSGGVASAMMYWFIDKGGYVATCRFKNGEFLFDITNNPDDIKKFAGSKYVKSNPEGIYKKITKKLEFGEEVLFIGLPCQVAALKNYIADLSLQKKLYTVDLICHGAPTPKILEIFLKEKGIDIKELEDIRFRKKTIYGLALKKRNGEYKDIVHIGVQDMYTFAFLNSLDYADSCYSCQYATLKRISDVTIGDSWGSRLTELEQKRGISLLLYQTDKGKELIRNAVSELRDVDLERAAEANCQLRHPSEAPTNREKFFINLNKGFHKAISRCEPKMYYKQKIKELFMKVKFDEK